MCLYIERKKLNQLERERINAERTYSRWGKDEKKMKNTLVVVEEAHSLTDKDSQYFQYQRAIKE